MPNMSEESRKRMSKLYKGVPMSEETKEKIRKKTQKRWDSFTPKEEIAFRKLRSKGMKRAWKRKTKDELAAISIRMSAKRYVLNRRGRGESEEEIDAFLKEKFGFTVQELEQDIQRRKGKTWNALKE